MENITRLSSKSSRETKINDWFPAIENKLFNEMYKVETQYGCYVLSRKIIPNVIENSNVRLISNIL